jgi:hypothetical protein
VNDLVDSELELLDVRYSGLTAGLLSPVESDQSPQLLPGAVNEDIS